MRTLKGLLYFWADLLRFQGDVLEAIASGLEGLPDE